MTFRACCIMMMPMLLLCAVVSTANATPTALSECLKLLNDKATTDDPSAGDSQTDHPMPNIKDTPHGHYIQRRTVHHEHGVTPSKAEPMNATSSPVMFDQGQVLRLATGLPASLFRAIRYVTVPVLNTSLGVSADLFDQLPSSYTFISSLNSESILSGLSGLEGNATRWLHLNGSSFGGSRLGNLSFPRITLFQAGVNSSSHDDLRNADDHHQGGHSGGLLFNRTRAGNAARQAAIFSERLLFSPVSSLLALTGGQRRSLPASLNPDHLQRHLTYLARFLGAARDVSTAAPDTSGSFSTMTSTEPTESNVAITTDRPPQ